MTKLKCKNRQPYNQWAATLRTESQTTASEMTKQANQLFISRLLNKA